MTNLDTNLSKRILDLIQTDIGAARSYNQWPTPSNLTTLIEESIQRSPFRRSASSQKSRLDTAQKINKAINASEPIKFSVPFGGYKLWRIASYPTPDWAEVFAILYLIEYALPIAEHYTPGVEISFSYCSIGVPQANNLEPHSIPTYILSLIHI